MKRLVTVSLGDFVLQSLAAREGNGAKRTAAELTWAFRVYLGDRDAGRPGWAYPAFLRGEEVGEVELELTVDVDLWRALEEEAGRQGVSVSQMASHAALYYVAELNAGRITQRILDELEREGPGGAKPD